MTQRFIKDKINSTQMSTSDINDRAVGSQMGESQNLATEDFNDRASASLHNEEEEKDGSQNENQDDNEQENEEYDEERGEEEPEHNENEEEEYEEEHMGDYEEGPEENAEDEDQNEEYEEEEAQEQEEEGAHEEEEDEAEEGEHEHNEVDHEEEEQAENEGYEQDDEANPEESPEETAPIEHPKEEEEDDSPTQKNQKKREEEPVRKNVEKQPSQTLKESNSKNMQEELEDRYIQNLQQRQKKEKEKVNAKAPESVEDVEEKYIKNLQDRQRKEKEKTKSQEPVEAPVNKEPTKKEKKDVKPPQEDSEDIEERYVKNLQERLKKDKQPTKETKPSQNVEEQPRRGRSRLEEFESQAVEKEGKVAKNEEIKKSKYNEMRELLGYSADIDINKIKKSKLYQKFVKDTEARELSTSKSPTKYRFTSQEPRGRSDSPQTQDKLEEPRRTKKSPPARLNDTFKRSLEPRDRSKGQNRFYEEPESMVEDLVAASEVGVSPLRGRNPNDSYMKSDHGGSTVNLNLNASSKYVAIPANQQGGNYNYPTGFAPPFMPFMNFGFNSNTMKGGEYSEINDAFLLRTKIQELNQNLQREAEINRVLEAKCQEYMSQLEKAAAAYDEAKKKIFDSNSSHQEELTTFQERIRTLNEKIADKEKTEEALREENSNLKRKINNELNSRGRLLDENEDVTRKYEESIRIRKEQEELLEQRQEDLIRFKKQADSDRSEINYLKGVEERLTQSIKELNYINNDLTGKNGELIKILEERDQRINMLEIENDNLKSQVNTVRHQYRELLSENESLKKEVFSYKERSLEAENDLRTSQMSMDKMQIEINQLREALNRTEKLLDKERRKKAELMVQSPSSYAGTFEFSRNENLQRTEDDYSTREEPIYQSSRRNEQTYQSKRDKEETQYRPKERDYKDKKPEYMRDNAPDYPVDKGSARKERETENKYSEYEAKKTYDTYQSSYRSNQPEISAKEPQRYRESGRQTRPFYVEEENSKSQNEERERRSRIPDNKLENKNEKSNDYISKYEQQFQKAPNKNTSSIIFGDPSLYNERQQQPNRTSINKASTLDSQIAAGDFRGKATSPPRDRYSTIQNPALKPTKGLLDWQEAQDVDNESKNRRREAYRQISPTRNAPFGTNENDEIVKKRARSPKPELESHITKENMGKEERPNKNDPVKVLETELMHLQMNRDNMNNELQKLEKSKIKSGATIKKKQELEYELSNVQTNISHLKNKLRELNVLHPY